MGTADSATDTFRRQLFSTMHMLQRAFFVTHLPYVLTFGNIIIYSMRLLNSFAHISGTLRIPGQFEDSLDLSRHSTSFVAPDGLYQRRDRLLEILRRHGVKDHRDFTYQFAWLEDHLNACAAIFRRGIFELAPPFLPSIALDIFEQNIRRVYLSATLESLTDFIRAFGRKPDEEITPSNDAGNGERLFINGQKVKKGFGPEFVKGLVKSHKAVVAVPDYARAGAWVELVRNA